MQYTSVHVAFISLDETKPERHASWMIPEPKTVILVKTCAAPASVGAGAY